MNIVNEKAALRPGMPGWEWPNLFPKEYLAQRTLSLRELWQIETPVADKEIEAQWRKGYNEGTNEVVPSS